MLKKLLLIIDLVLLFARVKLLYCQNKLESIIHSNITSLNLKKIEYMWKSYNFNNIYSCQKLEDLYINNVKWVVTLISQIIQGYMKLPNLEILYLKNSNFTNKQVHLLSVAGNNKLRNFKLPFFKEK